MTSTWDLVRRGRITGYAERAPAPVARREYPRPRVVVIIDLGPPLRVDGARYPGGFVAGLSEAPSLTEHDGRQAGLQLDLSPIEARSLFGVPMSELTGRCVALADLLPASLRSLPERLADLRAHDERFDLVDSVLASRLPEPTLHARVGAWASARIERAGGRVDVRALARELGYSEKQVGRVFRDVIGMTPKRYGRLVRFGRLVERLLVDRSAGWADLAVELGFYDQAHLAREVRRFAGTTPTVLRGDVDSVQALAAPVLAEPAHAAR